MINDFKESPDKFARSQLHLSEACSLVNNKLQEQQELLADIRKGSLIRNSGA